MNGCKRALGERYFLPQEIRAAMKLYAVTDGAWTVSVHKGTPLAEQVYRALKGGATCVQFREKNAAKSDFIELAKSVQRAVREYNKERGKRIPFIVNDDVEAAIALGADGVHAGQSDVEAAGGAQAIRRKIGAKMILGVSVQNARQASQAETDGADYLGAGAVFSTQTKTDAQNVSCAALKEICAAVNIPVVAIGGITAENAQKLKGTGISGVAVVSAIFAREDIEAAARDLANLIL